MNVKLSIFCILMSYTALAGVDREMAKSVFANKQNHSYFEQNLGQINYTDNKPASEVKFVFKQGNLKIFLLKTGLAYQLENYLTPTLSKGEGEDESLISNSALHNTTPKQLETYRMDMELIGANPNPEILAEGKSDDYTNYYQPNLIKTHSYQKITYKNIYPGIDWVIYLSPPRHSELALRHSELDSESVRGSTRMLKQVQHEADRGLKYDFIVHPRADPNLIKLKYKHAEQIYLDKDGNLILRNRLGDIKENAPIAFQEQKDILVKYRLNDSVVSFELKDYQKDKILVIDPKLEWSTYYGGTQTENCLGSEVDSNNNVYIYGYTLSTNSISYTGFQNNFAGSLFNVFLVKFNTSGKRLWGTYYGSNFLLMSGKIDKKNNMILVGHTQNSTDNYAHNGHQNTHGGNMDGWIVKFDSSGNRVWASYYGGSDDDWINGCIVDTSNNIYIDGYTKSYSSIAQNGYQDTFYTKYNASGQLWSNHFLAKFNETGTRQWGTYFGISNGGNIYNSLCIDNQYLYHARQYSDTHLMFTINNFGVLAGFQFFIAKFKHNGTRVFSTPKPMNFANYSLHGIYKHDTSLYLILRISSSGMPVLSTGFKTVATGSSDYLILRLDTNFNTVWATYCGGNLTEDAFSSLVFDKYDNMYFGGRTNSTSGIYYKGINNSLSGVNDLFITKISKLGNIIWSSYFGGNSYETVSDLAVNKYNNLYITGITGSSSGLSYNGHQNSYNGLTDAFLMKISCNQYDTIRDTICSGDSLLYRGKYLKLSGFYTDTLLTWDICDSFITLHLTVHRKDTTYLYDSICSGTSYVWNGQNKTTSGVYRDTLINSVGCDSFLILNLLVKRTDTIHVYDTSCANLPKTFNSQNLTLAGVYRDTLINNIGCDSHIFYHFIPKPIYETPISRAICANDSSLFGGKYRKLAGTYYDTLKTILNCDSVLKLTLTVYPLDTTYQTQSICRDKSYNFYSQVLTSAGTYSHKFTNRNSCDSLILLTLALKDTSSYALTRTICKNQFYSFNNQNLNTAGIYRDTLTNAAGCDSFITLTLLTNGTVSNTIEITRCHGDLYQGYTQSGTYVQTLTSHLGCDSLLTIKLTYLPTTEYKTISHSKCGAFLYGSRTYTRNDSFTETIQNYLNCDSILTKHYVLITEPKPKFLADKTIEFCEEIIHKGQLKTTSFFTQDTVKSLEFPYCDSLYQPYYYRRENRPILTAISKQIDTVIKGETTSIRVSGAQNYRWSTGEQNPSIRPQINEDKTFEVTVWNLEDCEEKMQFSIYAMDQPLIDFPTAFSPNGDGLNDYFSPNLSGNISIDYFQIFNRWGEKVYEHSPLSKGWDGTYQSQPAIIGVYSYTLRYSYLGRYFTKSGEVMVF